MTQDEIVEMVKKAGWSGLYSSWTSPTNRTSLTVPVTMQQLEAFAKLVAAKEREALAQEQEPVALETLLKWDDDIDPIGEVVGFIEGSPYIMVKVHKGKQVSLDDDLYATPPQRSESSGKPSAWVELTNEELTDLFYNTNLGQQSAIAQAIALLKEKNT